MADVLRRTKQLYFFIRNKKGTSTSSRQLSAPSLSAIVDKALRLYINTWKEAPDVIEVESKDTYHY